MMWRQIWDIDAKRSLRQPEEVVVRILEETEYLTRSRNSKQKEAVVCKHSSLGSSKCWGRTRVVMIELHCSYGRSTGTAMGHS